MIDGNGDWNYNRDGYLGTSVPAAQWDAEREQRQMERLILARRGGYNVDARPLFRAIRNPRRAWRMLKIKALGLALAVVVLMLLNAVIGH